MDSKVINPVKNSCQKFANYIDNLFKKAKVRYATTPEGVKVPIKIDNTKDLSSKLDWVKELSDKPVKWSPYNNKHVASKKLSWKKVVESTKKGVAKYKPNIDIQKLEIYA